MYPEPELELLGAAFIDQIWSQTEIEQFHNIECGNVSYIVDKDAFYSR